MEKKETTPQSYLPRYVGYRTSQNRPVLNNDSVPSCSKEVQHNGKYDQLL